MGKEQELVQAVKAEDVGTAQRLLQRPRPGKASECGGRAGRGRGPHRRGAGRGRDAVVSGGGAGPGAPRPLVRAPTSRPSSGGGAATSAGPSAQPPAGTCGTHYPPEAAGNHILSRTPSLPRLRADDFYLGF